jgi:myo-inositol-1(or 4)-monophosphatase
MFSAGKSRGAWLNGRRIHVSKVDRLEDALLTTGFPPAVDGQNHNLDWWRYFSMRSQSLRRTGSTAINLAYLAAGRFDGYWAFDNHVWDVAGGAVLVAEAGGVITNVDGGSYDPFAADALASNGLLHPLLLDCFRQGPGAVL